MSYDEKSAHIRGLIRRLSDGVLPHQVEFVFGVEAPLLALSLKDNLLYTVRQTDFMLCLYDGRNPNVFWEMGMAFGLGKPYMTALIGDLGSRERTIPVTTDPSIVLLQSLDEEGARILASAMEHFLHGLAARQDRSGIRLFMCHRSVDKRLVEPIALSLEGMGYTVWYDSWNIRAGDSIPASISNGIQQSTHFLLLLSKNTQGSSWVSKELNTALVLALEEKTPRIVPIFLDGDGKANAPTLIRELRGVEFVNRDFNEALTELSEGLE